MTRGDIQRDLHAAMEQSRQHLHLAFLETLGGAAVAGEAAGPWGEGQAERLRTGERYSPTFDELRDDGPPLDLVIVGGESGPGARPFDLAWARSVVSQCGAAGVKAFVKQLGAKPFDSSMVVEVDASSMRARTGNTITLKDRKGGDLAEWPTDLRVRELPEVRHA